MAKNHPCEKKKKEFAVLVRGRGGALTIYCIRRIKTLKRGGKGAPFGSA